MGDITLVLGGARSGKSAYAEQATLAAAGRPLYLATATPGDAEMAARIAAHRARRAADWDTVEAPLDLAAALPSNRPVLIDCLTLWLSNLTAADRTIDDAVCGLLEALAHRPGPTVLVSNEIGLGLVPATPASREFRDAHGRMNQQVAARADRVFFVAAGLPLALKGGPL